MAKRKRKANPTGALLVNPGKAGGRKRRSNARSKASKHVSLKHLFAAVGGMKRRTNKRKHTRRRTARRPNMTYAVMNPLVNPLVNRRKRRSNKRRKALATNRRPNPLVNRKRRHNRKRNPGGILASIARIPVVGPLLASTAAALGGSLAGGIAAVPLYYGVKPVYGKLPDFVKPVAFSLAGSLFAAALGAFAPNFQHKDKLVLSLAVGGGAIDGFRLLSSKMGAFAGDDGMGELEGEYGELDEGEIGEIGEDGMGDDGFGDAGDVRPAEWADADLQDATYSGEDFSADEITWAGYGRAAYRKRFRGGWKGGAKHAGASEHAGKPGARWGWLIYWIGFDNFKAVTGMPEAKRKDVIHKARHAALQAARQAISVAPDTTVESAEKAGLLAIH